MATSKQIQQRIKQSTARIARLTKELNDSKKNKTQLQSELKKAKEVEKRMSTLKKVSAKKKKVVKKN